VVHVHSLHSDGTGTVAEIADAAAANDLDFVLLTDHDTLAARDHGEEGWYERRSRPVLVLVGEEVSPSGQNHCLAFGLDRSIEHQGLDPQQIIDAINRGGGFGLLAHPFSKGSERFRRGGRGMPWRDLAATGYTGLELWSFVTDTAERINSVAELARFVAAPGRFVDDPPKRNLEQWDKICAGRRCVAIGGIDAHQIGVRVAGRVPLRLMSYKRSFRHLHTHLLCERSLTGELASDRETLYGALRAGHAYIAMDSLAGAHGFTFHAIGDDELLMGDEAQHGDWLLRARLPKRARVRMIRDGQTIAEALEAVSLEHRAQEAGVYRVEARLNAHGRERTWILSNPIYLR
jgi:hypothetical protein